MEAPFLSCLCTEPVRRPIICVQPEDQRVVYGQTARLIIELDNPDYSTTYQWYRNGEPMHDKTSPELLFHSAIDSDVDGGEYVCKVTNQGGSTNSNPARIKIVDLDSRGARAVHGRVQPDLWRFMQSQLQSRGAEDGGEGALLHRGPTEAPARTDQLHPMGRQTTGMSSEWIMSRPVGCSSLHVAYSCEAQIG